MDWKTFIISILGSGVVAAIVNGLMNYRTQIRTIRESGLYTKRAEVLDEIMKRMERLHRISGELVSFFQQDGSDEAERERRKRTVDALNYFMGHYRRNRHYLPKGLADSIEVLCMGYKELFIGFSYEARISGEQPNIKKWQELVKKHQEELGEKIESVANEFRKLIGVNN
ncbi:MAG: hypothetical protein Q7R65_03295 [bacterium]|nr:hypothetical protein [bacterium]